MPALICKVYHNFSVKHLMRIPQLEYFQVADHTDSYKGASLIRSSPPSPKLCKTAGKAPLSSCHWPLCTIHNTDPLCSSALRFSPTSASCSRQPANNMAPGDEISSQDNDGWLQTKLCWTAFNTLSRQLYCWYFWWASLAHHIDAAFWKWIMSSSYQAVAWEICWQAVVESQVADGNSL